VLAASEGVLAVDDDERESSIWPLIQRPLRAYRFGRVKTR
jgi:hypothetical protein